MIIEVIRDMLTFLVVMFVILVAFTEATYSLSNNRNQAFLSPFDAFTFTFYNAMGELQMDRDESDFIGWLLFFLCVLFNLIVMLNLLIAIISDTYSKVAST